MKTNSPYLRAMYIVLVPVVLIIILLNSGWLQSFVPAAHINGQKYSIVQYNFYYFDYVNSFLEQDDETLESLGYDKSLAENKQQYDADMTWRDYFMQEAEKVMSETAYYYDLAIADGYEFSAEELSPIDEQIRANNESMTQMGLNAKNYYLSYYGSGANENNYKEELTKKVKAYAYKQHLLDSYELTEDEETAYAAGSSRGHMYKAVNVTVITLSGLTDRETGKMSKRQQQALHEKYLALIDRIDSGYDFDELREQFSSKLIGDENGQLLDATENELSGDGFLFLFDIDKQNSMQDGDIYANEDLENGMVYVIRFDGFGSSADKKIYTGECARKAINEAYEEEKVSSYAVVENSLAMRLVTR